MIKAIIFDCFGVIRIDAFDAVYQSFGGDIIADHEFIMDTLYAANSGRISSSSDVFGPHLGVEPDVWRKAIEKGSTLNEELLGYILELRKTYKVGLLSNIGGGGFERMFDEGFLQKYFDVSVASGDIGYAKPEAEAYEYTADKLGVRIDECVFIDDRQPYVDGALHVGMKALLFESNKKLQQDLAQILAA